MKNTSVAILTDSGTDVPQELIDRFGIFVVPLVIHFKNGKTEKGGDRR